MKQKPASKKAELQIASYRTAERLSRAAENAAIAKLQHLLAAESITMAESAFDFMDKIVDPSADFDGWLNLGAPHQINQKEAMNWTSQKLMRWSIRRICFENGFALNILANIANFTVGKGLEYEWKVPTAVAREDLEHEQIGSDEPDADDARIYQGLTREEWDDMAEQAGDMWKEFARRQKLSKREYEIVTAAERDGEYFLRLFMSPNGNVELRCVDPDQVVADSSENAPWGIVTDGVDKQTPIAYLITDAAYQNAGVGSSVARESVPADEIIHFKLNVDSDVARGVPTLWPVRYELPRVQGILRHMAKVAQIQAAIAFVRKRTIPSSIEGQKNWLNANADKTPTDSATGKNVRQMKTYEGAVFDLPYGSEIEAPGLSAELDKFPIAALGVIRALAARVNLPDFFVSSDASNNNYASTMASTSPAVRHLEAKQTRYIEDFSEMACRWRDWQVRIGILPPQALALELTITGPIVEARDDLKEAQTRKIEMDAGVRSVQTWCAEVGLNYEEEQIRRENHMSRPMNAPVDDLPAAGDDQPTTQ